MATYKKYNLNGEQVGEVIIDDQLLSLSSNKAQLVKDYIVTLRANQRQWSANTKGRSEIAHSNAKPHPQKGTGRARQGTIKAAQYKGGATVFGPKPKVDQRMKMNKREKKAVMQFLFSSKFQDGEVAFLELEKLDAPKTKVISSLLNSIGFGKKKVLFLSGRNREMLEDRKFLHLSMRNLPDVHFAPLSGVNGQDLLRSDVLLLLGEEKDFIEKMLKGWQ